MTTDIIEGGVEDSKFNMAMLHYMEISEIKKRKSQALVEGDYKTVLDHLNELYTQVSFKLTITEQTKVLGQLAEISKYLSMLGNHSGAAASFNKLAIPKALALIRDTDREIMRLMFKYKMIFPKIEGHTGLDKINARYKLGQ